MFWMIFRRRRSKTAQIKELTRLLLAVVDLELSHIEEIVPKGYAKWNDLFEDNVQVTAWTAWQRDVDRAMNSYVLG